MSRTSNQANGDLVREFLSIADLLEEPRLAQLYAYLAREGDATVQELMEKRGGYPHLKAREEAATHGTQSTHNGGLTLPRFMNYQGYM